MKFRYILLVLLMLMPVFVQAMSDKDIMEQVEYAIANEDWEVAEENYRIAVSENTEEAELFFWKHTANDTLFSSKMALILGDHYKRACNYNKAHVFYDELIKLQPDDIDALLACADLKAQSGKEKEALELYERVLSLDVNNLPANIFIGNYYYYYAEKERAEIEHSYSKLRVPTKMQNARYREHINDLVNSDYAKAKGYLQRVIALFPSFEVKKVLDKIRMVEMENAR